MVRHMPIAPAYRRLKGKILSLRLLAYCLKGMKKKKEKQASAMERIAGGT